MENKVRGCQNDQSHCTYVGEQGILGRDKFRESRFRNQIEVKRVTGNEELLERRPDHATTHSKGPSATHNFHFKG